ncbi:MAG: hypothetical protein LBF74_05640 [Treponema sp.]|nr:hypothetical protein [Treponema sp.]
MKFRDQNDEDEGEIQEFVRRALVSLIGPVFVLTGWLIVGVFTLKEVASMFFPAAALALTWAWIYR